VVRFLPSILFLHLPELAVRFCNSSGQAAGFGNVLFGIRRSRESDNRLEAKIDRLLSEESTKPSSAIRRKKKSRAAA
jgi:hypothetical protein